MHGRARTAGSIKVHKPDLVEELKTEDKLISKDDSCLLQSSCNNGKLACIQPVSCHLINGWLSEKSIKSVQEKINYESSAIKEMYIGLLENEEKLQKDIDEIFLNDAIIKERKTFLLLQKWYDQSYLPLNRKINEQMNSSCYRNFDREKRIQYNNYLNHRNKKGHVFLDVYEKEEYDPLYFNSVRPGPLKAFTGKLEDPLLQQQNKRNEEERVVLACDSGQRLSAKQIEELHLPPLPLAPLGRHGTECGTWLDMKLTNIQSDVRLRSQARLYGIRNNSSGFSYDDGCSSYCPEKTQLWTKRRHFPEKYDASVQLV